LISTWQVTNGVPKKHTNYTNSKAFLCYRKQCLVFTVTRYYTYTAYYKSLKEAAKTKPMVMVKELYHE
jgi:hypothetical protein